MVETVLGKFPPGIFPRGKSPPIKLPPWKIPTRNIPTHFIHCLSSLNTSFWEMLTNVKIRKTKIWGLEGTKMLLRNVGENLIFIKVKSKLTSNIISIRLNSMPLLIGTNQCMHFYLVTLNIVRPIVFVENTEIKTLLLAIFDFLFFLHSAQIHSLILNL